MGGLLLLEKMLWPTLPWEAMNNADLAKALPEFGQKNGRRRKLIDSEKPET